MSLKAFRENPLYAVCVLFLYIFLMERMPFSGMFFCAFLWYLRTRERTWIVFLAGLGLVFSLSCAKGKPSDTGRVIEVHEKYSIVLSGSAKVIIYTDPLPYDSVISLDQKTVPVESLKSFFVFDFAGWLKNRGVDYQYESDEIHILKENVTVRRAIQKRIESCDDEQTKAFLNKVLLNISDRDLITGSLLDSSGFSLAGILHFLNSILSLFIDEKTRKRILSVLCVILITVYGLRMSLVMYLTRRLMENMKAEPEEKTAAALALIIFLYRRETLSAGFLMPAAYRVFHDCISRMNAAFTVQSLMNNRISPLQAVFFPYLMKCAGFLWLYGILILMFPALRSDTLILTLNRLSLITDSLYIRGSIFGPGLPLFLITVAAFRKKKYSRPAYTFTLIAFLVSGLFHPFAEVSFINVGQGDSILIRGPLNSFSVLVDTGKPSVYARVDSALCARGIRNLDCLIITHQDSDHAGNKEQIASEYNPEFTIESHQEIIAAGPLRMYDLNRIKDEDENRSSIVLLFQLNGLKYLLMGDADQMAEEEIVREYSDLKCDILKLSHHGSHTGSCDLFLDTVRPELAVVSSGAWQIYHHPAAETVQRLLKRHIPYLDTKDHGDISILCLGRHNLLICSDGTFDLLP